MHFGIALGIVLTGTIWLGLWVAWTASAERRASRSTLNEVQALEDEIATRRDAITGFEDELADSAEAYVRAHRWQVRTAYPLENLRELGAKNVRWTALAAAGVRNLEDVVRAGRAALAAIPGVGDASVDRLLAAASVAEEAINSQLVPLPVASRLDSASVDFVAAIARARRIQADILPALARFDAQLKPIAARAAILRQRAGLVRWIMGWHRRGGPDSVLEESRSINAAVTEIQQSANLRDADAALQDVEANWGRAKLAAQADARQRVSAVLAELQAEMLMVLSGYRGKTALMSPQRRAQVPSSPAVPFAAHQEQQRMRTVVPASAGDRSDRWIPPGQEVEIQGYRVPSGMIYVGNSRSSNLGWSADHSAVIDPSLPVDLRNPDYDGKGMTYWPVYELIPPASRAAYLEWLAGGRREPHAYIGYVFLFFYGLERRMLYDALADPLAEAETAPILTEVRCLLDVYGANGSFRGYATSFLEIVQGRHFLATPVTACTPPEFERSYELPLALRIGLGRIIADGRPVPADWALAWLRAEPSTRLRTPAERCPKEFEALFCARFTSRFDEGLRVSPGSTALVVRYRTASSAFEGPVEVAIPDLPDVSALTTPVQKLQALAEECTDALAAYSRWLGRHPEGAAAPAAAALLPPELAETVHGERIDRLTEWAERTLAGQAVGQGESSELIALWGSTAGQRLAKVDAVLLAQFFEKRGYGIEPDVRFGSDALEPDGSVVVFRHVGTPPSTPSPAYSAAATLLRIGSVVAGSDGTVAEPERHFLERHLENSLGLAVAEQTRLRAHLRWLQQGEAGMAGMSKRVDALTHHHDRAMVGEFLVGVAAADGRIEPGEVKTLLRLFPMLGLAEDDVYRALHRFGMPDVSAPTAPVTVKPASPGPSGYAIPAARTPGTAPILLDLEKVRGKLAESDAVFGLLKDIFTVDEPAPPPAVAATPGLWGLDGTHSAFLRELAEHQSWSRTEFEAAAARYSLLPDGAIETINDAAFETHGGSFIDGDDPLELQIEFLKEESA
jgi:tellurite resistance protein